MKNHFSKLAIATICAAFSTLSFGQTSLAPGTHVLLPDSPGFFTAGYTAGDFTNLTYGSGNFTGVNNSNTTVFTGTLYEGVWQNNITGGLDFWFSFVNNSSSTDQINQVSLSHFAGYTTSVLQDSSFGGTQVDIASRGATGDTVNFLFLNGVQPGTSSTQFLVMTNAKSYTTGTASLIDGGDGHTNIYAPQAVPEPCSIGALALGGIALLRRRKNG